MASLLFVTHPEVEIDPARPVARWVLSPPGIARMRAFAEGPEATAVGAISASAEAKATEAAGILAARLGLGVSVAADLGENDRTATGFLPPAEFEAMADAFFARPNESVRGWERAADARARIRNAVRRILAGHTGAVGTLLLSALLGQPISRAADQPYQGHFWTADLPGLAIRHRWRPIAPR